ncbi:hypothetical protein QUB60_13635 [Microcoleus sp. A2-C5]|nr:hypothetical protein [Lyngbya sp. CCAP 1446/10]MCW6053695.1 hypothetical protein [Lyngbya sp. CCAP 1446/10]
MLAKQLGVFKTIARIRSPAQLKYFQQKRPTLTEYRYNSDCTKASLS